MFWIGKALQKLTLLLAASILTFSLPIYSAPNNPSEVDNSLNDVTTQNNINNSVNGNIYYIKPDKLSFQPSKTSPEIYGTQALTVTFSGMDQYIQENAQCKFYWQQVPTVNTPSPTKIDVSGTYDTASDSFINNDQNFYTSSNGCSTTIPQNFQDYPYWKLQLRVHNQSGNTYPNATFGIDANYAFKIGVVGFVNASAEAL
jgi:hypothetical protein